MSKAIGLRFVPFDEKKHLKSHFLGAPLVKDGFLDDLEDNVLFLGMIHLPDIAKLDPENKLPHEGYLYFFLDDSDTSRRMKPIVRYCEEEPDTLISDFNEEAEKEYRGVSVPHGIEFVEVEESDDGCKLLGVPQDWNYPTPPTSTLLLSLSHYDEELDFLPELDGYTYIFFGPIGHEFDGAYGFYEYS